MQPNVKVLKMSDGVGTSLYRCDNGSYSTNQGERFGPHSFEHIWSIRRNRQLDGSTPPMYPIVEIMVDNERFVIGDLVRCKGSHQKIAEPIIKFDLNFDKNVVAMTKSFMDNGINATKLEKNNPKNISEYKYKDTLYKVKDFVLQDNYPMQIQKLQDVDNVIIAVLADSKYPMQHVEILIENIGPITSDPNEPDAPRTFEINPLFISEDGVNIFEGDIYWRKYDNDEFVECIADIGDINDGTQCFSSKEALEEYWIRKSIVFSYEDIIDLQLTHSPVKLKSLRDLVKLRLDERKKT